MISRDEIHRRNPYRSELWCELAVGHGLEDWPQRERDINVALSKAIYVDKVMHLDRYGCRSMCERHVLDAVHRGAKYLPHYMVW